MVLALAAIVDMTLTVDAVLAMVMEATKVYFLFDCSVLFSTFLMPLCPPYPTKIQQQCKLWAGRCFPAAARARRSFFRFVTSGVGIGTVVTAVAAAMIVVVVAVVMAVAILCGLTCPINI